MRKLLPIVIMFIAASVVAQVTNDQASVEARLRQMEERTTLMAEQLRALEQKLNKIEADALITTEAVRTHRGPVHRQAPGVAYQQALASSRMAKDSAIYSKEDLDEIEKIYQAGVGRWATSDGRATLKTLTTKYPKSNRTGCALLLMGEVSRGAEREKYFKKAISGYSDSFFGDGVRVGAWGRYLLAEYYTKQGKGKEAKALYQEILEKYPNAVDPQDRALKYSIEKRI